MQNANKIFLKRGIFHFYLSCTKQAKEYFIGTKNKQDLSAGKRREGRSKKKRQIKVESLSYKL